jgi:hypothetical protein
LVSDGEPRRQRLHRAPRMVKKRIKVERLVGRPDSRTHWGFMAPDIKKAFDELGVDFGGYILGEDGRHHLRQEELISVLWKGVQELTELNSQLERRLSAVEGRP